MSVSTTAGELIADPHSDSSALGHGVVSRGRRLGAGFRDLHSRSRRLISEHRHKRRQRDREVSDQSRRGLDWTNFFMADVQIGFGSFLAFYLADLGWSKQNIGLALTVGGLAGVVCLIPGGAVTDAVRWKRALTAVGIGAIGLAALMLAWQPSMPVVLGAEVLHGVASGILTPAIAAISLGLAGRHGMSSRVGRNYRFAAAGNALTAAAMGLLGTYLSNHAIFLAAAALCLPALIALQRIKSDEIDYIRARNATRQDHAFSLHRLSDMSRNWKLLLFAGCLVLFHLANAPLLPLVSENLAHGKVPQSPLFMAGLLIVPQVVVAILAPWIGYWSELWGRKPLLLAGFAVETARALLFAFTADPWFMMAVQALDGITGAVVTVLTVLVVTDFTTGSGRFNLAQGVLGAITATAAAIGTGVAGVVVQHFGDLAGFISMAATVLVGTGLLWAFVPETKPARYVD
jgi:MFS family permease